MEELVSLILAAGEGTRMKSSLPKVLHPLCGKPMLQYSLDLSRKLGAKRIIVVIGHQGERVKAAIKEEGVEYVLQPERKGSGHAVLQARDLLADFGGILLVLCADVPLLSVETIKKLIQQHLKDGAACTILTVLMDNPTGYGRILRKEGKIERIVEEREAKAEVKRIKEVNTAIYCFQAPQLFPALAKVGCNNRKGEYYLTDVIEILGNGGATVSSFLAPSPEEVMGINTRKELVLAEQILSSKIKDRLLLSGVTIKVPESTLIDETVRIGKDTVIYPHCLIEGETVIGMNCHIGPHSYISNSRIGEGAFLAGFLILEETVIEPKERVFPFQYLRGKRKP